MGLINFVAARTGIAAALIVSAASMVCAAGYLPLTSDKPGHVTDLVLIYQGGHQRLAWTAHQLAPYVTWKPADGGAEQWLFDGFLFIEFSDGRKRDFAKGYGGQPARKTEWQWLLERNFARTNALGALESVIAETSRRLGPPPVRRKVVLTLPEPIKGQTDWGEADGRSLDFNRAEDRIAACQWHVDLASKLWREAGFKHLDLAGFYWVAEQATGAHDVLPKVGGAVRQRGLKFYWIPYWRSDGAAKSRELGFDYGWQQPNHFFHPGKVEDSRLGEATAFARAHGLGLEFEADGRALSNPGAFRPRFYEYLKAFDRDGVKSGASVAYYEGGGALLQMANAEDPEGRAMYDALAGWVAGRQKAAYSTGRKDFSN